MPAFRHLALGDSYTIGESVSEAERWPNQLAELLRADGVTVEVTIIAHTGWTTDELWQGMQAAKLKPPYDLVSLLIGVNNQYRRYDINEYHEQFVFLLNKSIEYAGGNQNPKYVLSKMWNSESRNREVLPKLRHGSRKRFGRPLGKAADCSKFGGS